MQIIAHLPVISIQLPTNLEPLYAMLISVVTFDLFGTWIEGKNFG